MNYFFSIFLVPVCPNTVATCNGVHLNGDILSLATANLRRSNADCNSRKLPSLEAKCTRRILPCWDKLHVFYFTSPQSMHAIE